MEDERNTPQDEDAEVEAHSRRPAPMEEPGHAAREDDDEVEAHARRESHIAEPEARRE